MNNEYLNEFIEVNGSGEHYFEELQKVVRTRSTLVRKYAWAVPDTKSIEILCKYSPIIEIGAGNGYWASLVKESGGDIVAYDASPLVDYQHEGRQYHSVLEGSWMRIEHHPERTLFLCWPPYDENLAVECLRHYEGDTLIFVGEGPGGCTADDDFFEELGVHWEVVEEHRNPQWNGVHDYLSVFRRN